MQQPPRPTPGLKLFPVPLAEILQAPSTRHRGARLLRAQMVHHARVQALDLFQEYRIEDGTRHAAAQVEGLLGAEVAPAPSWA